jgi:hypothetical protein
MQEYSTKPKILSLPAVKVYTATTTNKPFSAKQVRLQMRSQKSETKTKGKKGMKGNKKIENTKKATKGEQTERKKTNIRRQACIYCIIYLFFKNQACNSQRKLKSTGI